MLNDTCHIGEGDCSKTGKLIRGWCRKHYQQLRTSGNLPPAGRTGRRPSLVVHEGQRFGRGVVLEPLVRLWCTPKLPKGIRGARLLCDCGVRYDAPLFNLIGAGVRVIASCGCATREAEEAARERRRQNRPPPQRRRRGKQGAHRLSRHPLYITWYGMLDRVQNPDHKNFVHYGARGIRVCDDWQDVRNFVSWIEVNLGPKVAGMTLDRIDNNGHYEPGNVRWATQSEHVRNSRRWENPSTHCSRGHEFTPGNTHMSPGTGSRTCRTCRREDMRARRAARRNQGDVA